MHIIHQKDFNNKRKNNNNIINNIIYYYLYTYTNKIIYIHIIIIKNIILI